MSGARRVRMTVSGIVQGVGFRPFLHRLAREHSLFGWVRNTPFGVEMELEGTPDHLKAFEQALTLSAPPLAVVERVQTTVLDTLAHFEEFSILPSAEGGGGTLVSPDIALCPACEKELKDPADRRYRYPFINCTDCGPRYTIIRDLPYDRAKTSMAGFPMCAECSEEYADIRTRRYHAQPDCCPVCGPSVSFLNADGTSVDGDPFEQAQKALAAGAIVAVKGIGGIHLACDARNEQVVSLLRRRKHREEKPLAVMCRDLEAARRLCRVTEEEQTLLENVRRPIVLLAKKRPDDFPFLSNNGRVGVMLPYTPLHVLLLDGLFGGPDAVVMTSANLSDQPVLIHGQQALTGLSGIADFFLLHNRPIQNRCDDSLVMAWQGREYFFRRSRGYAPQPVRTAQDVTGVIAFGAEQKASFAVGRECHAFLSPHIGDLKNLETLDHYRHALDTFLRLFRVTPRMLVCDLHPDYWSTREALQRSEPQGLPVLQVQHHWAHMAACMADNELSGPVFGIVWDGTGLGLDSQVWGGEFLVGDCSEFQRVGSIRPVLLPGGDAAVREISRVALSLLWDAELSADSAPVEPTRCRSLCAMLERGTACTPASSIGRLFDGVYSLLTGTGRVSYEGQGATLLEAMFRPEIPGRVYPVEFYEENGIRRFDTRPLMRAIAADCADKQEPAAVARGFMDALCRLALEQCRALNVQRLPVVLSGGVFLNRYLLENITRLLTQDGYSVFTHHRVSTSDEGICLGQLAIAAQQRRKHTHVSGCSFENHKH